MKHFKRDEMALWYYPSPRGGIYIIEYEIDNNLRVTYVWADDEMDDDMAFKYAQYDYEGA